MDERGQGRAEVLGSVEEERASYSPLVLSAAPTDNRRAGQLRPQYLTISRDETKFREGSEGLSEIQVRHCLSLEILSARDIALNDAEVRPSAELAHGLNVCLMCKSVAREGAAEHVKAGPSLGAVQAGVLKDFPYRGAEGRGLPAGGRLRVPLKDGIARTGVGEASAMAGQRLGEGLVDGDHALSVALG